MKLPKQQIVQTIEDTQHKDELVWWEDEFDYSSWAAVEWSDTYERADLSWQWHLTLSQNPDWHYVVVSHIHKNITVENWITEHYPMCEFRYENNHFLIKDADVATIIALKFV